MVYESFTAEIEEREFKFTASLIKLENAVFIFFDNKGNSKLGTLSIAMPQFDGKTCISSIILGTRNEVLTKILAEYFAKTFNSIALVSTHFTEISESKVSSILLKLAEKLSEKAKST
ncbi:MAG: hypothetical protein QG670_1068 [Thermoproteota archaeon]|nr:hypothetical protein [Thermoproteota archaeon]